MRGNGTFEPLRHAGRHACVEVRPSHRDRNPEAPRAVPWSWGEYVRRWRAQAWRTSARASGAGAFAVPRSGGGLSVPKWRSVARSNGQALLGATVTVAGEQRKPCSRRGMHQGMTRGMRLWVPKVEVPKVSDVSQGTFEIAARIQRERELGLADRDIAALLNRSERSSRQHGFVHWTGYAVRVSIGEATYAA